MVGRAGDTENTRALPFLRPTLPRSAHLDKGVLRDADPAAAGDFALSLDGGGGEFGSRCWGKKSADE
jgi:hypothetical protein